VEAHSHGHGIGTASQSRRRQPRRRRCGEAGNAANSAQAPTEDESSSAPGAARAGCRGSICEGSTYTRCRTPSCAPYRGADLDLIEQMPEIPADADRAQLDAARRSDRLALEPLLADPSVTSDGQPVRRVFIERGESERSARVHQRSASADHRAHRRAAGRDRRELAMVMRA